MYLIEGNIGAGKSTFADILRTQMPDKHVVSEPIHMWHAQDTHSSLLGKFLQDPQRWAYTMETFAMMSRVRDHMYYQAYHQPVIMERSVYSGHYCFARNGFRQGFMTLKEWEVYMQYFYYLIPRHCRSPKGFIFLHVSPEVAHERIRVRARDQEEVIPLSYLQQLDDMHHMFLTRKEQILPELASVPVLHLSVDQEFATNQERQRQMVHDVYTFMQQHG